MGLLKIAKAASAHYIQITDKAPEKHPKETDKLTFTFVTGGIESAVLGAKASAGRKNVTIIGSADTVQKVLNAGLADELQIDIIRYFSIAAFGHLNALMGALSSKK